jgi:hypothetical protein
LDVIMQLWMTLLYLDGGFNLFNYKNISKVK